MFPRIQLQRFLSLEENHHEAWNIIILWFNKITIITIRFSSFNTCITCLNFHHQIFPIFISKKIYFIRLTSLVITSRSIHIRRMWWFSIFRHSRPMKCAMFRGRTWGSFNSTFCFTLIVYHSWLNVFFYKFFQLFIFLNYSW